MGTPGGGPPLGWVGDYPGIGVCRRIESGKDPPSAKLVIRGRAVAEGKIIIKTSVYFVTMFYSLQIKLIFTILIFL